MNKKLKKKAIEFLQENIVSLNSDSKNYLYIITTFLKETSEEPFKNHISDIKKAITQLNKNFDETYLLFIGENNTFFEQENKISLDYLEELSDILNENKYYKESENLANLRAKLHLGYQRYFSQNKNQDLVRWFNIENNTFELYQKENQIETFKIIESLQNKEMKKQESILVHFPDFIYNKENIKLLEIEKSLFMEKEFNIKELKKEKVTIQNLNSLLITCKILNKLSE